MGHGFQNNLLNYRRVLVCWRLKFDHNSTSQWVFSDSYLPHSWKWDEMRSPVHLISPSAGDDDSRLTLIVWGTLWKHDTTPSTTAQPPHSPWARHGHHRRSLRCWEDVLAAGHQERARDEEGSIQTQILAWNGDQNSEGKPWKTQKSQILLITLKKFEEFTLYISDISISSTRWPSNLGLGSLWYASVEFRGIWWVALNGWTPVMHNTRNIKKLSKPGFVLKWMLESANPTVVV